MGIVTNNVPRDIIEAYELTEKERAQFDYLDWEGIESGNDSASFVRYKNELYDLGDLEYPTFTEVFEGWDAFISETFFSGIVLKFVEDNERIVMGRYYG